MSAYKDGRCPKPGCGHSKSGYHVGPDWCAICTRQGGTCVGEASVEDDEERATHPEG